MNSKVARKLDFHIVLVSSIKSTYIKEKSEKNKRAIGTVIMNSLIMRYRLQNKAYKALGLKAKTRLFMNEVVKQNILREKIHSFYLSENVSHTTTGMKETITRNKVKQQKRYLNSTWQSFTKILRKKKAKLCFTLHLLKPLTLLISKNQNKQNLFFKQENILLF